MKTAGSKIFSEYAGMVLACPICRTPKLSIDKLISCPVCGATFPEKDGVCYIIDDAAKEFIFGRKRQATEAIEQRDADDRLLRQAVVCANIDYHDKTASEYDSSIGTSGLKSSSAMERIRKTMAIISSGGRNKLFLDIGCGTGRALSHAGPYFNESIGLDISPEMVKTCLSKMHTAFCGSCYKLPFQDASIDAAASISVLHHLPDPENLILEALRALKSGGVLYIDLEPNHNAYRLMKQSYFQRVPLVNRLFSHRARLKGRMVPSMDLAEYQHTYASGIDPVALKEKVEKEANCRFEIFYVDNNLLDEPYLISAGMKIFYLLHLRSDLISTPAFSRYFALLITKV